MYTQGILYETGFLNLFTMRLFPFSPPRHMCGTKCNNKGCVRLESGVLGVEVLLIKDFLVQVVRGDGCRCDQIIHSTNIMGTILPVQGDKQE